MERSYDGLRHYQKKKTTNLKKQTYNRFSKTIKLFSFETGFGNAEGPDWNVTTSERRKKQQETQISLSGLFLIYYSRFFSCEVRFKTFFRKEVRRGRRWDPVLCSLWYCL